MMDETKERSSTKVANQIVTREKELFGLAFELAFFIHANKEIAFFIAEDAVEDLTSVLTYQKKNRAPADRLRGFWKWGERTRPIRKTLILDEYQMLQWLVYKHSEKWERQTEDENAFYAPSEEDLIVRYIEHLVFLTARRGSFYVTLAVCSLLHQLDRRETRLFYDVLTQSDAARMKDAGYIGKQRLELLDKVFRRFERMVDIVKTSGGERQFLVRPGTDLTTDLVKESLRRFTPWGSSCVIKVGFDVTDIPELYFSEVAANEDDENLVEVNRIHTVLHPECLRKFTERLGQYVGSLPNSDLDKNCNFHSLDERIALPKFRNTKSEPPRPNRFETPSLQAEDYVRLRRTLDARGHRKKTFVPQLLSVYVDGQWSYSFEAKNKNGRCVIGNEASFIEVRGSDTTGEVALAMLVRGSAQGNYEFEGSVVHAGGQKVSLKTKRFQQTADAEVQIQLEINYTQNRGIVGEIKQISEQIKTALASKSGPTRDTSRAVRFAIVGIAILVLSLAAVLTWRLHNDTRINPSDGVVKVAPAGDEGSKTTTFPTPNPVVIPSEKASPTRYDSMPVAQARWTTDRNAALHAISLEPMRSDSSRPLPLSESDRKTIISVPLYDHEGRLYARYRIKLLSGEKHLWQQTLIAPKNSLTGYTHVVEVVFSKAHLTSNNLYDLQVEGFTGGEWHSLGKLTFSGR
jgi:hypothetical protein